MRHSPILARCAFAVAAITPPGGTFAFVSLFNNSPAPYVLAVRDFGSAAVNSSVPDGMLLAQGQIGANPVSPTAVYPTGPTPPGLVYTGSVAALPAYNFTPGNNSNGLNWFHDFPAAVIPPGWALTVYVGTVNLILRFGFWWEWMYPAQILNPDIGPEHIAHH